MLGTSLQLLTERPDQCRQLLEEPGLIPDAVEELLAAMPDFTVDAGSGTFAEGHYVRRYASLPFSPQLSAAIL